MSKLLLVLLLIVGLSSSIVGAADYIVDNKGGTLYMESLRVL